MRITGLVLPVLLLAFNVNAQSPVKFGRSARIYVVRHAEKVTGKDAGKDPLLTAAGIFRSGDLYRALKDKQVIRIYASQYKRSIMTGDSLRLYQQIDTVRYKADTLCDDLLQRITQHNDLDHVILIIGHSNTVPRIIRKLGVLDFPVTDLPDYAHDDLFLVRKKGRRMTVKHLKYGQPSQPDQTAPAMKLQ